MPQFHVKDSAKVIFVANFALTDFALVILTVQVPVPEHPPPDQPVKVYPLFAEAVKVTDVSES